MSFSGSDNYLDRVNRLRVAAAWNQRDAEDVANGWTIIPVFDADIVKLFLDPKSEAWYVEPISIGGPADDEERNNSLGLFAKITAEFIFLSNDLEIDGRVYNRLWQTKPLLTPPHAEDVGGMVQEIERKLRHAGSDLRRAVIDQATVDSARRTLAEASERCKRAQADDSPNEAMAALSSVERNMPTALRGFIGGPAIEALRFVRMVDEELVVPLASSQDADAEVLSPPAEKVKFWNSLIWAAKKGGTGRSVRRAKRTAERDAVAMAQVEMLNQRALEQPAQRRRYVLITGDRTLHSLYEKYFWSKDRPLEHYILRHPLQYVPFLNFKSMPNDYGQDRLFKDLTTSLDNLIWDEARVSPSYRHSLEAISRPTWIGRIDVEALLAVTGDQWWRAVTLANAFNFRLAIRDDAQRLSQIFEFLALPRISDALVRSQHDLLGAIGAAHLASGVVETLRTCVADAINARKTGHQLDLSRVPLPLFSRFAHFIGDKPLVDFLEQLAAETPHSNAQLERLTREMKSHLGPSAFLFASATAAAAGKWGAAEQFLERVLRADAGAQQDASVTAIEMADAKFLKALVLRFDLEEVADFREALRLLNELEQEHQSSSEPQLHLLRTLSERAALRLAFFVHSRVRPTAESKTFNVGGELHLAGRDLSRARVLMEKADLRSSDNDRGVRDAIAAQIANNSLEQVVYRRLENIEPVPQLAELLHFSTVLGEQPKPTNSGEQWLESLVQSVAKYLLTSADEDKRQLSEGTSRLIDEMLNDQNPLPQIDRELAGYFRERLRI